MLVETCRTNLAKGMVADGDNENIVISYTDLDTEHLIEASMCVQSFNLSVEILCYLV